MPRLRPEREAERDGRWGVKSEKAKLVEVFRGEGASFGQDGDDANWSPAETAIEAMRMLKRLGHANIVRAYVEPADRKAEREAMRHKYARVRR